MLVWSLFLRTHAAVVPRIEQDLQRRRQLPLAWYDVLLELNAAAGRRLRMQELGNRVVLSRTEPAAWWTNWRPPNWCAGIRIRATGADLSLY